MKLYPIQQPEAYQQRLVDWISSGNNGFFHPQVVWNQMRGDGPYAMHMTIDLLRVPTRLVVPRSYIFDLQKTHDGCITIAHMLGEEDRC